MKHSKLCLVCLLVLLVSIIGATISVAAEWTGYTPISSAEDLKKLHENPAGKYYLTQDIDMTEAEKWTPVGDFSVEFSGVLDGNGHSIIGLKTSVVSFNLISGGLIGCLTGTVRNLEMKDGSISVTCMSDKPFIGECFGGGIAGYVRNTGVIENCINNNSVFAASHNNHLSHSGGIAGYSEGIIRNCKNYGTVSGACTMGGIVGETKGDVYTSSNHASITDACAVSGSIIGGITGYCLGDIAYCYNTADLGGDKFTTGGIAGTLEYAYIENCYNTGDLSGKSAGIYRGAYGTYSVINTIKNCYNIGESEYGIANTTKFTAYKITDIINCYHLDNVAKSFGDDNTVNYRLTHEEMKEKSSFRGFDFYNIWTINTGETYNYPILRNNQMETSITSVKFKSKPTKTMYYKGEELDFTDGMLRVSCIDGLAYNVPITIDMVTGYQPETVGRQKLTVTYADEKLNFEVIVRSFAGGSGVSDDPFQISTQEHLSCVQYDLNANYILTDDIIITDGSFHGIGTGTSYKSFKGTFEGNGHYISGLTFIDDSIDACRVGLFGENNGTIRNLGMVNVNIQAGPSGSIAYRFFGGIAGLNRGTIENCYVFGKIKLESTKLTGGGIVGANYGTIQNCFNAASLSGRCVAGIYYEGDYVRSCYNVGYIFGRYPTCGITNEDVGFSTGCYYLDTSCHQGTGGYDDYAIARTEDEMRRADAFKAFDFETVWEMSDNSFYPYPILKNVPVPMEPETIEIETTPDKVMYTTSDNILHIDTDVVVVSKGGIRRAFPLTNEMLKNNTITEGVQEIRVDFAGKTTTFTTQVCSVYSGSGTSSDPYIIKNSNHLKAVTGDTSSYYKLENNITFKSSDALWEPIESFSGVLDGNGYRIENLRIEKNVNSDETLYAGLFGRNSGTISNLGLSDCNINISGDGDAYVGGFAGELTGVIKNCYSSGNITVNGKGCAYAGGIVGYSSSSSTTQLVDCFNLANVTCSDTQACSHYLGGIVGHIQMGISCCYNAGTITGVNVGAITADYVGSSSDSSVVDNYYLDNGIGDDIVSSKKLTTMQMQDAANFSGFDFESDWFIDEETNYLYPQLQISPLIIEVRSVKVKDKPDLVIYNEKTQEITISGGMLQITYSNGFVCETSLENAVVSGSIDGNSVVNTITFTYAEKSTSEAVKISAIGGGAGTQSDPYQVSKKVHLDTVRYIPDACYILTENIIFTSEDFAEDGAFYNNGKLWQPIGADSSNAFSGSFDGDGHSITGLRIKNNFEKNTTYLGLFGYVTGTVKNIRLQKIDYQAEGYSGYMGGVAGCVTGAIFNCYIEGGNLLLKADSDYSSASISVGGVAGNADGGSIFNCHNAAAVCAKPNNHYDTAHAGGIVGFLDYGEVYNCYNIGNINSRYIGGSSQGANYAGGIAAVTSGGSIADCYNTGEINACYAAGGIAGYSSGSVSRCYNIAEICADYRTGAVSGLCTGTMKDCYYLEIEGVKYEASGNGRGTANKVTEAQMKEQATFVGFDFANNWTMEGFEGYDYPELCSNNMISGLSVSEIPTNITVPTGNTVSVTVYATGDGLEYTWYIKNATDDTYTKTSETTDTYTCTMDDAANGRKVYCVVTDKYGNVVETDVVTISNLAITTQPKSTCVANGKTAKVTVKATGDGLTYAWYSKNTTEDTYTRTSNTTDTYSCTMDDAANGRKVYCVVTDKYGNVVETDVVTISNLAITTQPKSTCVANGKTAKVTVKATGDGLTYTWYVKSPTEKSYKKSSNTTNTYKCTMSSKTNGRKIYCVVTDKYGNVVETKVVTLSNLAIKTQPKNTCIANDKTVKVTVKATGSGLKYKWYVKDAKSKTYKKSSITSSTYKCTMSSKVNGRKIYCVVTDKYGNVVETKVVTLSNLAIITQPKSTCVANGKTAKVTVKATGSGLKYKWYVKDAKSKTYKKSSITSSTYKCTMSGKVNGRKVYCEVTDKYGNTVKTKTVKITKR